jgi:tripartite-type tricarboxylate transporter receptor subunit TctC
MNDMNRRSALMACASSLAALSPSLTFAQTAANFPSRPVRWVVPTSTGAGTDFAARTFAQIATESWKQSLVVENRPGASGMLGLDFVAGAAPDGHTLLFFSVSQFIDATLLQKYTFEANKDFTPISMLATTPLILMAHADAQVSTVQQLIAKAKAQPKALNYSSGGSGGLTHLAMEVFLNRAGIEVLHVPYKGSGPAIIDLLSNVVQLSFSTPPAVMQHVKSGRLKALAVTTPTRDSLLPDVPTFAELGMPTVNITSWYGVAGPANLPADITEKISRTIAQATKSGPLRDKLVSSGLDPILSTPAEMSRTLRLEREQLQAIVKAIGFKKD